MAKKSTILKWMLTTMWIAVGAGVIVLLVAAMRKEDKQVCKGLNVTIHGVSNNFFVDKNDILKAINEYVDGSPTGQPISVFNLRALETELQKNVWVKKAQMFFDNNQVLQASILEREPVARIFTVTGSTFYVDTSRAMLPLSDKFSAMLPVFTNFPSDKKVLTKADSLLLGEIVKMSLAIQQDSFRMAMIDQVDITSRRTFEMVPKIGNTLIEFGNAENAAEKFRKLQIFYKEVIMKSGWDYYNNIDVQYAGQVVARRKGAEEKTADSLRTLQIMQLIAVEAEQRANDSLQTIMQDNENNSTNVSLIQQSFQREDNDDDNTVEIPVPEGLPVIKKPILTNPEPQKNKTSSAVRSKPNTVSLNKTNPNPVMKKPVVTKPAVSKPAAANTTKPVNKTKPNTQQPKAVMPKKNDY